MQFLMYLASKDYSSKAEDLVLDSVTTKSCVVISILNDVVPEFAETFTVKLTIDDENVDIITAVTTVTISDDDGKFKYVYILAYSVY